jgi:hypothetical protein
MSNDDIQFSRGPARRPQPPVPEPLLQWATGLQTSERRIYAGWLVEAGKIDALDEAMEQAGFSQVTIKHGNGNLVTHWAVETANLFVIADGVQSIGEMKHTTERYGIAFGWKAVGARPLGSGGAAPSAQRLTPNAPRMQSQMRFRAFLRELLEVGFTEPLLVTVKGTLTGDLIGALTRQYEVLDVVDAFRKQDGKPALNPPFYACSIPLGPGQEVLRGSGSESKEITPIVADIPTHIAKEYILQHWIKRPWVQLVEGLIEQTIAWSVATSALIAAGEERSAPGIEHGEEQFAGE